MLTNLKTRHLLCFGWIPLLTLTVFSACSVGQGCSTTRPTDVDRLDLERSLRKRLTLFTEAQADGEWESVSEMLGRYRVGKNDLGYTYTPGHKSCLINEMKSYPIDSFTAEKISNINDSLCPPLDRPYWIVWGETGPAPDSQEHKHQLAMFAYRDQGQWYFTPPDFDSLWQKSHLTEDDLAADYSTEIEVQNPKSSPLDITELHVFLDKENPSNSHVAFKLKNRTSKEISGYHMELRSDDGGTSWGGGYEIAPLGFREEKLDNTRYVYLCDRSHRSKLTIKRVWFSDGSEWNSPAYKSGSEKRGHQVKKPGN